MNKPYDLIISSAALLEPLYTQYLAEYFEVAWHRCPRCQGLRHGHGGHERWVLCAPGQEGRLFLRHVRCRSCHTVETVFPPWLLPYERLTVDRKYSDGSPRARPISRRRGGGASSPRGNCGHPVASLARRVTRVASAGRTNGRSMDRGPLGRYANVAPSGEGAVRGVGLAGSRVASTGAADGMGSAAEWLDFLASRLS